MSFAPIAVMVCTHFLTTVLLFLLTSVVKFVHELTIFVVVIVN